MFIKKNYHEIITKSIKALEINTILSCFFFFFLIIELYVLIPAAIAHIFNPIAELVTPIGITIKEAKEEIEMHSVNVEAKTRN